MINRKMQPPVSAIDRFDYIPTQKLTLTNGLPVYFINAGSQDVVKIDFIFEAGTWQQPANLVATLSNNMLEEGSARFEAAAIAERFDFYGSYIQLSADQNYGVVSIISLNRHLPAILEVTEDLIKNSVFPDHEFGVLVAKNRQRFLIENEKVKTLCQKKFTQALFGMGHPYAIKNTVEDYDRVTKQQVWDFYRRFYHAGNCRLVVAGKVDNEVLTLLEWHFGGTDWAGEPVLQFNYPVVPDPVKYHHVDKPDGMQSAIRVGKHWVHKTHDDYIGLSILTTILGGYFGSRLMANIREDKGYTYGIGAYVLSLKEASYLVISTEVGNEYVEPTLSEIQNELKRLQDEPVSADELETVKNYLFGEFLRDFDGPFALSGSFRAINDFGLDYAFYDRYLETIRNINPVEIQRLGNEYLSGDEWYTVVAGSKS